MARSYHRRRGSGRYLSCLVAFALLGWVVSHLYPGQISRLEATAHQVEHCASALVSGARSASGLVSSVRSCPLVASRSTASASTAARAETTAGGPSAAPPGGVTGGLALLSEPESGFAPLRQAIDAGKRSVDLTMYELVDQAVEAALAAAARRGVDVRVILDQNLERAHNQPAFSYLSGHGVHVVWANRRYAATHQKTLTVDDTTSVVMTANLVAADYPTTRDFLVVDTVPADVAAIETTFSADLDGSSIAPPDGADLVWSPTNSQASILSVITGATHSLAVENEEMGLPAVTAALEAAAHRGVTVTVTMTASPSWTQAFDQLATAGAQVALYPNTAHVLYVHAKAVVADAGLPDARAFVGSENFSSASLTRNRELGLATTNQAVVGALAATLTADHRGAQPWHL